MKNCPICHDEMIPLFKETILHKYCAQYFFCTPCSFIQTEQPYWLKESYGDVIASTDTGLIQRLILLASKLAVFIFLDLKTRALYVDIAGGRLTERNWQGSLHEVESAWCRIPGGPGGPSGNRWSMERRP